MPHKETLFFLKTTLILTSCPHSTHIDPGTNGFSHREEKENAGYACTRNINGTGTRFFEQNS
jgi:hypothetical protein